MNFVDRFGFSFRFIFAALFVYILITLQSEDTTRGISSLIQTQTIVTLSKLVTPQAIHQCLKFIYSGSFDLDHLNLKVCSINTILNLFYIYIENLFFQLILHFQFFN